jgi:hypothetical protein
LFIAADIMTGDNLAGKTAAIVMSGMVGEAANGRGRSLLDNYPSTAVIFWQCCGYGREE